ncbi:hypothetical protein L210DRAFT_3651131 [Boletus edulis BED1]|uniref:DUF6534 domain-containing protein n=1 Tax=Boletus edulis BED1 TaxID=1328754 RepID=A0AAD4GA21_BOLED|nr:hypothetical protein L210DRAFT_3651131 [Boletus edulis BED1]
MCDELFNPAASLIRERASPGRAVLIRPAAPETGDGRLVASNVISDGALNTGTSFKLCRVERCRSVVDMIIFVIMCYSLRRARYLEMAVPDGFLQTIATMLVGRGLTFTIAQMAYFSIFIIAPSKQYWIPLQMVASKLYVNTLNSRHVRQGQGLYEEHSITDRNVPSDGPFPTSIRLNVTDAKVTTQSINLATRNTARRVMAWGLSRERDRGNVYAHVSTGTGRHSRRSVCLSLVIPTCV